MTGAQALALRWSRARGKIAIGRWTADLSSYYEILMRYGWHPDKAASNSAKHGVGFEAADLFDWSSALVRGDTRQDYGEARLVALGAIGDRLHVLVCTIRRPVIWVISLRLANRKEVERYASES